MSTEKAGEHATALNHYIDSDQLKKDLDISTADLSAAMATHSGLYFMYASHAVRARAQADRYKTGLEVLEASLDSTWRQTLQDEYESAIQADPKSKAKPPTEPKIKAAVINDPKWKAMNARVREATQVQKLCDAAERAFEHRKDMLIQMARDAGRQLDGGPVRVAANQSAKAGRENLLSSMRANAGTQQAA